MPKVQLYKIDAEGIDKIEQARLAKKWYRGDLAEKAHVSLPILRKILDGQPVMENSIKDVYRAVGINGVKCGVDYVPDPPLLSNSPDDAPKPKNVEPILVTRIHISNLEEQPITELVRGREKELEQLEDMFFPNQFLAKGVKVAITGVGGMGKTTLALEYARRNASRYPYSFFCSAKSQANLTDSFVAIAELLKEEDAEIRRFLEADPISKEYKRNVVLTVRNWLQRASDYLLILDNADLIPLEVRERLKNKEMDLEAEWQQGKELLTEADLTAFLPNLAYFKGNLLITSRNAVISDVFGLVSTLELEQLTLEATETFLLERVGNTRAELVQEEQEALKQLATGLYGLPLALEQAGAYIKEMQQAFSTYLNIYLEVTDRWKKEEHVTNVLERRKPQLGQYDSTVATTWLISFGAVLAESKAAAEAFTFSAFLDPEAAPMETLKSASEVQQKDGTVALPNLHFFFQSAKSDAEIADAYDNLLAPLTRYSLVKKNMHPVQTFQMHRIVQAVRRRTLTDGEWKFFAMVVEEVFYNAFL